MHNGNKPNPDELPSSKQLLRSTIIALVSAIVILVTIVLPAEYGIDPTKIGRVLGLAEMGEIKTQLAEEAEADRQRKQQTGKDDQSNAGRFLFDFLIGTAQAQSADEGWTEKVSFVLTPGQGAEWKLSMKEGDIADFKWVTEGGVVNYDLHGDGGGNEISYERGRGVPGHDGALKAAFTGSHGWFWRNRDKQDVTVTLFVKGQFTGLERTY
ncbi:MAG: transmembrane anchor protein [Alphaproteobacteria bacterium]|nr:transmembrane anchor protein [Alphaproteobacteria bacterium]